MKASTSRRSWQAPLPPHEEKPGLRRCDHPGCAQEGAYRAPVSRERLGEYYWFCLDHVRSYNAAWDFHAGMSPEQIEIELRRSTTWERETWPLGQRTSGRRFAFGLDDPFGLFEDEGGEAAGAHGHPHARAPTPEEEAVKELDLGGEILTIERLKARYKELVKRHHPDANNGDKSAEERFKRINQAYHTLRASLAI